MVLKTMVPDGSVIFSFDLLQRQGKSNRPSTRSGSREISDANPRSGAFEGIQNRFLELSFNAVIHPGIVRSGQNCSFHLLDLAISQSYL